MEGQRAVQIKCGIRADLREMITGLREQYSEAWLEEAIPFRLPRAPVLAFRIQPFPASRSYVWRRSGPR